LVRRRSVRSATRKAPVREAAVAAQKNLAAMERSLYNGILRIRKTHRLERLGVAFYDSQTTLQWSFNADTLFHAASTIKIAVLVGAYAMISRGELTIDAPVHVRNRFTSIVDGSPFVVVGGPMDAEVEKHQGRTMTIEALAYEMITKSSNLATNLLIDVVGVETIRKCLEELRIDGIVMVRGVQDEVAFQAGINNLVTANGVLRLLRMIADGRAYSPEVCAQMLEILLDTRAKSGIPAGVPGDASVAHKTGNISTVHHDAGIVFLEGRKPYVLVILTQFDAAIPSRSTAVAEVSRDNFECLAGMTSG
jgi:beta-lactamase class A